LNYFNYFTEIEDAFVRRRGKHLHLSPMDWALIESWKEMNVPLHVALRGIEKAFDSWESKPRKRTVKSLLYCQEEVEAQYAEWIESRVGAGIEDNGQGRAGTRAESDLENPFSRAAILEHLGRVRAELLEVAQKRQQHESEDDLSDALTRAAALLAELEEDFSRTASANAQKLEDSLTGLERMLNEAILLVVEQNRLDAVRSEIKAQLRPYRKQMDQVVYQQTSDNLLLKRLREHLAVPRLSLFYL
jgi:hypothetical protein